MAVYQSVQVRNGEPVPSAKGSHETVPVIGDWVVPASGLVTGDIIEMAPLPAGYVVVDVTADHATLGTAFTGAVGIMSGNFGDRAQNRTCGAEFIAAATYQAAAVKKLNVAGGTRVAPTENDRSIGFVISSTLTSPVAGAALRITALIRPQSEGV